MLEALEKQLKRAQFARFVADARPLCQGLDLQALLITPVQRIPRYKLLFEELLKQTPSDDPEFLEIQDCLKTIKEVANKVNAAVEEKNRRDKLLQVQQRLLPSTSGSELSPEFDVLQPNRWLLREGPLLKVCPKGSRRFEVRNLELQNSCFHANIAKIDYSLMCSIVCVCVCVCVIHAIMFLSVLPIQRQYLVRGGSG
jgi:hypothetical protein